MADLKSMTVAALKELARKHLGPGYSKLKTKSELVAALAKVMPEKLEAAIAPAEAPIRHRAVSAATAKEGPKGEGKAPGKTDGKTDGKAGTRVEEKPSAKASAPEEKAEKKIPAPARVVTTGKVVEVPVPRDAGLGTVPAVPPLAAAPTSKEPPPKKDIGKDPDDYLVARLEVEGAVEVKLPLPSEVEKEKQEPPKEPEYPTPEEVLWDRKMGELPGGYNEDTLVLLPKDPTTAFVYWDFSYETIRTTFEHGPHWTRLNLYEDGHLIRESDFHLDARSWYFFQLMPGHAYRVEIIVYSPERKVRLGPSSNSIRLPNLGPSPVIDDRFGFIPFDMPLNRLTDLSGRAAWGSAPGRMASAVREHLYQLSVGRPRAEFAGGPLSLEGPYEPSYDFGPDMKGAAGGEAGEGEGPRPGDVEGGGPSQDLKRLFGPGGLPRAQAPGVPPEGWPPGGGRHSAEFVWSGGGQHSASAPWSGSHAARREDK